MSKKNTHTSGDTIPCIGCSNTLVCSDLGECGNEISKKINMTKGAQLIKEARERMAANQETTQTQVLLLMGWFVIESMGFKKDKNLSPWVPVAAFLKLEDAMYFFKNDKTFTWKRLLTPN